MPELNIIADLVPIAIQFVKPLMTFKYKGGTYVLKNIEGRSTERTELMRMLSKPVWDEVLNRWEILLSCNIVDMDLSNQFQSFSALDRDTYLFQHLHVVSSPRRSFSSIAQLIPHKNIKSQAPSFPADLYLYMYFRSIIPGKLNLINTEPGIFVARNLTSWPPPIGTVFIQENDILLYPEYIPFIENLMDPVVIIKGGDSTIITDIYHEKFSEPVMLPFFKKTAKYIMQIVERYT